jgi:thymidine kinase
MSVYLNLIIGPMFAGKSTELIKQIRKCKNDNIHFCVVKPSIDNRYELNKIATHNKDTEDCIVIDKDKIHELRNDENYINSKIVFIEEGQFFKKLYEFVKNELNNKSFVIAGLDGDYKRDEFGDMLKLIPLCDKVKKLSALCKECNYQNKAPFTKRITKIKKQEFVGGEESYIPVCRKHFEHKTILINTSSC